MVWFKSGCTSGGKSGCSRTASHEQPDTGPLATLDAGAPDAQVPESLVNLLYKTPAVVAVSSKVNNPRDFPEHLIDGKPETAWNGKTGDLVGGWIAFRVPRDAHVTSITLSAGFDAKSKGGEDLFTANHRIAKVRWLHDGAAGGEAAFDTAKRSPQRIAINAGGGEYRIEVLEVVPGTKKAWRELVISELAVWGRPGTTRIEHTQPPEVRVGSLDAPAAKMPAAAAEKAPSGEPYASLEAMCAAHVKDMEDDVKDAAKEYPGFLPEPLCEPDAKPLVTGALPEPFVEVRTVHMTFSETRDQFVAVKTRAGFYRANVILASDDFRSPHCAGACSQELESAEFVTTAKGPALVVKHFEHCFDNPFPSDDPDHDTAGSSDYTEQADVCYIEAARPTCRHFAIASAHTEYRAFDDRFTSVHWDTKAKEKILPDGEWIFEGLPNTRR